MRRYLKELRVHGQRRKAAPAVGDRLFLARRDSRRRPVAQWKATRESLSGALGAQDVDLLIRNGGERNSACEQQRNAVQEGYEAADRVHRVRTRENR